MNLIQYRLTNKPRFFLLKDVPKMPIKPESFKTKGGLNVELGGDFGYEKALLKYNEAFKLYESKALEIVNPEVLPNVYQCIVDSAVVAYRYKEASTLVKHNDTFSLPEDVEFKEIEVDTVEDGGGCYVAGSKTMIRISKKEEKEPVKEESQEELISFIGDIAEESTMNSEEVNKKPDTKTAENNDPLNEIISLVHEHIEGRYELTAYDLGIIHSFLCSMDVTPLKKRIEELEDDKKELIKMVQFYQKQPPLNHAKQ